MEENKTQEPLEQEANAENAEGLPVHEQDEDIIGAIETEQEELAEARQQAGEMRDRFLRLNAEFDNYKKRTLKERMELLATASSDMMVAMLPVMDDFERAIKAISVSEDSTALNGIQLIYNKLKSILESKGLEAMNCTGAAFDADLHEAITTMPIADEAKKNTVIEEVEKGYLLKGKVIRHAKVVVGG